MKNKIGIIALALGLLFSQQGVAQGTSAKPSGKPAKEMSFDEKIEHQITKRTRQLSLTEDQQKHWRESIMKFEQSKQTLKQQKQTVTTREEKKAIRNEMQQQKDALDSAILVILNPEQEAKWMTIQNKEKQKREKKCMDKKSSGEGEQKEP